MTTKEAIPQIQQLIIWDSFLFSLEKWDTFFFFSFKKFIIQWMKSEAKIIKVKPLFGNRVYFVKNTYWALYWFFLHSQLTDICY